ncbi:uncharacterized protein LOC143033666 [Oratosquilla oratoria]|uniref:uncharacterized protein LOC143033666 n=1 Tax=Oratosquilla oratoria TaxID=337810 RepID=UPI003F76390C
MWHYNAVVLFCLTSMLGVSWGHNLGHQEHGCGQAFDHLIKNKVATTDQFANLPSNGTWVCKGGACCEPAMTEGLLAAGLEDLRSVVRQGSASLHGVITTHAHDFKVEQVVTLLLFFRPPDFAESHDVPLDVV